MSSCCHNIEIVKPTRMRRLLAASQWLVPSAILALMPKCPACVVGYVAIATGLGISLSVASFMQTTLILVCYASLAYLAFRRLEAIATFFRIGRTT
jgi:hypothetical protein